MNTRHSLPPLVLALLLLPQISCAETPATIRGRWVFDAEGRAVPPRQFERGLQTSGLVFWKGVLWSVGDQRSEYPAHLFRIDPATSRLIGAPIPIRAVGGDAGSALADYRTIRNPDLEGITVHPRKEDTLLGVIEDKRQWLLEIAVERVPPSGDGEGPGAAAELWSARLVRITPVEFPDDVAPYRDDSNYRLEGLTASRETGQVYVAYERLKDGLPAIYQLTVDEATSGAPVRPERLRIDFASVPPREDKPRARLNINGLDLATIDGREHIVAVARDQERVLVIDPSTGAVRSVLDLHLRSPDGELMLWVSPEGIAVDPASRRVWIVNDPDSIRGNYRLLADERATGNFAKLVPLLFEVVDVEGLPSDDS